MGQVVTDYIEYFKTLQAFHKLPAERREPIRDGYFAAARANLPYQARLRIDIYNARHAPATNAG